MIDKYNYLIDNKIGKLKILSLERKEKKSYIHVNYICDCGKTGSTRIYNILNKPNISCGCNMAISKIKYNYNENAFKTLNTKSAYTLGLLYSDGCLVKNKNEVKISLVNDLAILEKLSIFILNTIKIKTSYNVYNKMMYNFNFCNSAIYKDLLNWGLYPAKSKTLKIHPDLKFNSHFWRGMIDGDGCIMLQTNKERYVYNNLTLKLCGTIEVCESFKKYCLSILPNYNNKIYIDKGKTNFAVYATFGEKAECILNELYKDSNDLFLKRKKEKFNEYINYKLTKNEKH